MKILITGDIANSNINNFSINNIDLKYLNLIKQQNLVIYNLEGQIIDKEKCNLEFRESKIKNYLIKIIIYFFNIIFKKKQIKVSSNNNILDLLKLNKKTIVTLANNHIKDYGKKGFINSIKKLKKNNIEYIGAGLNKKDHDNFIEHNNIIIINTNWIGVKKSKIFLSLYSSTKKDFGAHYLSSSNLKEKINILKNNGKKIILIVHAGRELPENYLKMGINFDEILNIGADITIIHHPHIYIKTKYEEKNIYILGDFIFNSFNNKLKHDRQSAVLQIIHNEGTIKAELIKFKVNEVYKNISPKPNILHIIDSSNLGGVQTLLKGLFEYNNNNNIFLYSLRKTKVLTKIKHNNYFLSKSSKKYSFFDLFKIKNIIINKKINILHCHQIKSQFFGYLLKLIFFHNIKLVFHEHGQILSEKSKNIFDIIFKYFLKIANSKVDSYICISNFTRNKLIKLTKIDGKKIALIYNFIDLNKFNRKNFKWSISKEKYKLGLKNDNFVVGFAGRLIERKGWKEFIESARILNEKYSNIKFIMAGDGRDRKKLIKLIKKYELNNVIIFLGYISNMVWFYSLLDCLIVPSYREPMGLTEIEAQALGIPVISANVPALNEIIKNGKNGLFFEVKNSLDLARKIDLLYNNKILRNSLINNGIQNSKLFNIDIYINKLNSIYN